MMAVDKIEHTDPANSALTLGDCRGLCCLVNRPRRIDLAVVVGVQVRLLRSRDHLQEAVAAKGAASKWGAKRCLRMPRWWRVSSTQVT